MNHRDYLKKRAVKSWSKPLYKKYKIQRNRVNHLVINAKSIDANKHNPKEMWKNMNLILGRKNRHSKTTKIASLKSDDINDKVTNEKDIANNLNQYFTEIGVKLSNDLENTPRHFSDYI